MFFALELANISFSLWSLLKAVFAQASDEISFSLQGFAKISYSLKSLLKSVFFFFKSRLKSVFHSRDCVNQCLASEFIDISFLAPTSAEISFLLKNQFCRNQFFTPVSSEISFSLRNLKIYIFALELANIIFSLKILLELVFHSGVCRIQYFA